MWLCAEPVTGTADLKSDGRKMEFCGAEVPNRILPLAWTRYSMPTADYSRRRTPLREKYVVSINLINRFELKKSYGAKINQPSILILFDHI